MTDVKIFSLTEQASGLTAYRAFYDPDSPSGYTYTEYTPALENGVYPVTWGDSLIFTGDMPDLPVSGTIFAIARASTIEGGSISFRLPIEGFPAPTVINGNETSLYITNGNFGSLQNLSASVYWNGVHPDTGQSEYRSYETKGAPSSGSFWEHLHLLRYSWGPGRSEVAINGVVVDQQAPVAEPLRLAFTQISMDLLVAELAVWGNPTNDPLGHVDAEQAYLAEVPEPPEPSGLVWETFFDERLEVNSDNRIMWFQTGDNRFMDPSERDLELDPTVVPGKLVLGDVPYMELTGGQSYKSLPDAFEDDWPLPEVGSFVAVFAGGDDYFDAFRFSVGSLVFGVKTWGAFVGDDVTLELDGPGDLRWRCVVFHWDEEECAIWLDGTLSARMPRTFGPIAGLAQMPIALTPVRQESRLAYLASRQGREDPAVVAASTFAALGIEPGDGGGGPVGTGITWETPVSSRPLTGYTVRHLGAPGEVVEVPLETTVLAWTAPAGYKGPVEVIATNSDGMSAPVEVKLGEPLPGGGE